MHFTNFLNELSLQTQNDAVCVIIHTLCIYVYVRVHVPVCIQMNALVVGIQN